MRKLTRAIRLASFAVIAALFVACGGSDTAGWSKPYTETTCPDVAGQMTGPQREAMARLMLRGMRDGRDPSAGQLASFAGQLQSLCQAFPDETPAKVAGTIYELDNQYAE